MQNKECRFSYNDLDDSLLVSCKENNENVKERFIFGNFIFSLTGRGKIVGIQILNASEVLPDYNINSDIINKIEKVYLFTDVKKGVLCVALSLLPRQQPEVKIQIPLMNFHPMVN
jgi:hypothetical protein